MGIDIRKYLDYFVMCFFIMILIVCMGKLNALNSRVNRLESVTFDSARCAHPAAAWEGGTLDDIG